MKLNKVHAFLDNPKPVECAAPESIDNDSSNGRGRSSSISVNHKKACPISTSVHMRAVYPH